MYCDGIEIGRFTKSDIADEWYLKYKPISGGKYSITVDVSGYETITAETTFPSALPPVNRLKGASDHERYFEQTSPFDPYYIFHVSQRLSGRNSIMRYPVAREGEGMCFDIGSNHPGLDEFNAFNELMEGDDFIGDTKRQFYYLRIDSEGLQFPITFKVESISFNSTLVYFRSVSYEYDMYIKTSVQKIFAVVNEYDPTYWFDEKKVYCNINGGLGIFGAYDDYVIQINKITDYYFNNEVPYEEWPFDE